jgi:hypothetical protein
MAMIIAVSHRAAEVTFEPSQGSPKYILSVLWRAQTHEPMRVPGVTGELNLAAGLLQCNEHLLALPNGAALIRLAMDDKSWRGRPVRKL